MKKVIAFDLDNTLAPSKSPLPDRVSGALSRLLDKFQVCVISGGKFGQFEKQVLANLQAEPYMLERLHFLPTCGTRYYVYDLSTESWKQVYAEDFTEEEKKKITKALDKGFNDLGYREEKVYGERIEDRGSQITYSVFGQDIVEMLGEAGLKQKEAWDPDDRKKMELRDYISIMIPEFEVRSGGITSIDVTKPGVDKGYGMRKLMSQLHIGKEDILFIGDKLQEGGNDYPVRAMGIDWLEVSRWQDTALVIEGILHVL